MILENKEGFEEENIKHPYYFSKSVQSAVRMNYLKRSKSPPPQRPPLYGFPTYNGKFLPVVGITF